MSKARKNSRRSVLITSLILSSIIAVSATFAWVTAKASEVNRIGNEGYIASGVVVTEKFDEDNAEIKVGEKIEKVVSVTNTGSTPVLVRVAFEEMLNVLGASGAVTWLDSDAAPASTLTKANYNAGTLGASWVEIASTDIVYDAALSTYTFPAGTKIYKDDTDDELFYAFLPYGTDSYQAAQLPADCIWNGTTSKLEIKSKLQLGYFTAGTDEFFSWTGLNHATDSTAKWYNPVPDFTSQVGLGTVPGTFIADEAAPSMMNSNIMINFASNLTATLNGGSWSGDTFTPGTDNGKWYFNATDGFFYYIGVVESASKTTNLLDSIKFSNLLPDEFQKAEYKLVITAEAIQAVKAALSDTTGNGGWALSGTILTALQSLCEK